MTESKTTSEDKYVSANPFLLPVHGATAYGCAAVAAPRPFPSWQLRNKVENVSGDGLPVQQSLSFYNIKPEDKYLHSRTRYEPEFIDYIKRTSKQFLKFQSSDGVFMTPYKHRWERSYRKAILAKLYQLQIWAKRHGLECGMLSLTSAQRGYSDIEILERYKNSWAKLQDILHKMGYQHFMLYEPHKSGVPHQHAMIFGDCSKENMERLEKLYVDKYGMSDGIVDENGKQHAFDFSPGLKDNPVVESVVNYLMKYLSKTVVSDITHSESLVRFHSLFYHTHSRLWSSSRFISFVMRKIKIQPNKTPAPIDFVLIDETEIYNRAMSNSFPCKYQTIKGIRYKYELLPFEIKPKYERKYDAYQDNHSIRKFFMRWEDLISLLEDI
jgi:hypothetical protein